MCFYYFKAQVILNIICSLFFFCLYLFVCVSQLEQKMDQKTWLQRKRSPEKSIAVNNEAEISVKGNEKEVAYLICECNDKDRIVAEHVKASQETNTGRERVEALVAVQKQELENILQQRIAVNERFALKNSLHQLSSLKVEQDLRVNLERAYKRLESKYTEARKKLANLTVENARLTKSLVKKKVIIEDVSNQMSEAKEEFNKLISRLDSTERGNNVLKYEYHLLEKELKIKSRHADVAKLEAERQKLRMLVKKRVPGNPKMKPSNHPKVVDRRMSLMEKRLCEVDEENKILKERICKKENEIRLLKAEIARMKCDEQNNGMEAKLLESEKKIVSLKTEVEFLKESKKMPEDHFENLKLINFDLDHQLSDAKVQIKEALRKVSFLEMELEDKSHHREEIEATCLDLQLQLASVSVKDEVTEDIEQEGKLLQTGLDIKAELNQYSSLRDHMAADDDFDTNVLRNSCMIKDVIHPTETKELSVARIVPWALPIVSSKKCGKGTRLLKKLLFRRKRGGNKKLFSFAAYKFSNRDTCNRELFFRASHI